MNKVTCLVGRPLNAMWLGRGGSCQSFGLHSSPVGPRVAVFRWDDGKTDIKCIKGDGRPDGSTPFHEYEVLKFDTLLGPKVIESHVARMAIQHFELEVEDFKYSQGMMVVRG